MNLIGSGEASRNLGITMRRLELMLLRDPKLEPKIRVSGRRAFSAAEVQKIKRRLPNTGE